MKFSKTIAALTLAGVTALSLSGCGFRPIYATADGGAPASQLVSIREVNAPETVATYMTDALNARMGAGEGLAPRYELYVNAREGAERLAVQIDATVTRYNYRLSANYTVIDNETGERFRGVARAVTSYNIVNSQYSTLFAERAAIEKAARQLAEEIERDLLIRFAESPEERAKMDPESFETVLDPSEILIEPRRGETVEPLVGTPDFGAAPDPVPEEE